MTTTTGTGGHSRRTADVVVVGGGILGAATAHQLATHGHRVVVLERGAVNREGSGTTAGNLHIQAIHARRPGQAVPVDIGRFLPLQLAANSYWAGIEAELAETVELRRSGGLTVAETEEQLLDLRAKHEMERAIGLETQLLDGDEARAALPLLSHTIIGADWCDQDGYANPLLVTPALLRAAHRAGAEIRSLCPVTTIERRTGGWVVYARDESWSAGAVVDVAGPWIADVAAMAGIRLDMSPLAIQMLLTERVPPAMHLLVQHIGEGLSVKQVTSGQFLVGGGWPARSFDPKGRSPTSAARAAANARLAVRVVPALGRLRLLRSWAGPLAATPDEMPVVGPLTSEPGWLVAGGTYAFTLAPLWARCLRAFVEGVPPPVPVDDLGPDRLLVSSEPARQALVPSEGT